MSAVVERVAPVYAKAKWADPRVGTKNGVGNGAVFCWPARKNRQGFPRRPVPLRFARRRLRRAGAERRASLLVWTHRPY
jgi:hypothetical protein